MHPVVTAERQFVLEESPLLSDCVTDSLESFKNLEHLPRKISSADMFVDVSPGLGYESWLIASGVPLLAAEGTVLRH